jgi:tetratricopeptide (TPR) repeat protein
MIQIPLTKIGFFNPGRLSDEEIEQFFITRIPFFEYLFEKIASERPKSIPQHYLVIGQRGMGKTSLLMRIATELRKAPYNKKFIALSFPEEQYNVDRLSKFWLNCLDALADALDKENNKTELELLDAEIATITKQNDVEAKTIYELFCKWTAKIKRRPVLLVDNLNLIFAKITIEEQHQLRGTLISNDAPILVGASASTIEETVDYGAPFYDAFQISYLKKLSFEESLEVLLNLAKITGNENFENNVYKQRGRLEALYDLTGGTPRTLAILFPLVQDGFSEKIQTDLDALLDVITPLYKARFEELAPQLQVVMDAVALNWDPINLDQLRTATQLPNSILSPQLKRLTEVGWLQKLDAYKAKGGAYELSERFFNVWYLMRRSSRRQKRELYCLTKFLESFYGADLHDIAKNRITCKSESINHIALDLALADAVKDKDIANQLRSKSFEAILDLSQNNENIMNDFNVPQSLVENKISELYKTGFNYFSQNKNLDAIDIFKKVLRIQKTDANAWINLAIIYRDGLFEFDKAETSFLAALEMDSNNAPLWNSFGLLLKTNLKKNKEAEVAFKRAVKIDSKCVAAWNNLANLYYEDNRELENAESAYKISLDLNPDDLEILHNLGNLYNYRLKKSEEAEMIYKKIIESKKNNSNAWNDLGNLYKSSLSKYEEAELAYKNSIEINSKNIAPLVNLANLYSLVFVNYVEAENYFKKALFLDDSNWNALVGLADLYRTNLGRFKEAESLYLKANDLNGKGGGFNNLGNLYQDNLKKYLEAEIAYSKAIYLDADDICAKYNLVFLLRDKLNKLKEAKELFSTIQIAEEFKDSHYLNKALFSFHDKNIGIAESFLQKALLEIGENLPTNTEDDWYRSTAAIIKLGYGENLLNVLAKNGYDTILRPFYVAIQFLTNKEEALFFNSIAAEVREPAKKIAAILKNHID